MRRFVVLGCDHSNSTLEEVARARIPVERLVEVLTTIRGELGLGEVVYLSTCHRTEWYLAYQGELCPGRLGMRLAATLSAATGGLSALPAVERCLTLHGRDTARHLFRVS
jgi:glutamyl-tRNA reductase